MKPSRLDYWHLELSVAQKAYEQDKALFNAIQNGDCDSILALISKGAYISEKFFEVCINYNRASLIQVMIDNYDFLIYVSKNLLSKLCIKYVMNRHLLWYILQTCSVSSMYDVFDPLVHASIHGDINMIMMIITRFSFARDILYSPFFWGAKSGHCNIVSYIFDTCKSIDEIHLSNTLLNVVHDCCNQEDKIYICAPVIRLLIQKQRCTLFHCVEKCYEKQNSFILALLIPFLPHGYFANETQQNTIVINHAFTMRRATRRIIKSFYIHRRFVLARTLYKSMSKLYSPSITAVIAKHGNM